MPEQVQDFYPTPSTHLHGACITPAWTPGPWSRCTCPRSPHEKAMQRALIQYRDPKNYRLVHEALVLAGREDLIGFGPKCLIKPPRQPKGRH